MSYASVFTNGGSQAVRIPAAFRFTTDRVSVEAVDGGILLRPVAPKKKAFFEFLRSAQLENGELDLTRDRDVVLARDVRAGRIHEEVAGQADSLL